MASDPELLANTREWLRLAKEDLDNVTHDLAATPPFFRSALFRCPLESVCWRCFSDRAALPPGLEYNGPSVSGSRDATARFSY